jgi:hypothetical protein
MADRVAVARRRGFVGRVPELEMFSSLIRTIEPTAAVLFVHGPPGIGKSTLLRRFAGLCDDHGIAAVRIDSRELPATVGALEFRFAPVLDEAQVGRTVILLDTYELLAELDSYLREEIAPRLPGDALLVIAGQHPPTAGWRTDPGWADLLRVITLRNLSSAECHTYLTGRGIEQPQQQVAVEFTHGHPLALALVGEVIKERGSFAPQHSADVIAELVGTLVRTAPTTMHRRTLEAAAQVRVLTESLLADLLDIPDAAELFGWMRTLPFADPGPQGLHMHDLARTVLAADLRWRHPDRYVELHARARRHYLGGLEHGDPQAQMGGLMDLMYLHSDLRRFLQAPAGAAAGRLERGRPDDIAGVVDMVRRHEGPESAAWAEHWFIEQPASWFVIREPGGAPAGVMCLLQVSDIAETDDPAVLAARHQLQSHAPLRPGERVSLVRFWMARETHQSVSPVQSLITTQLLRHYLTTPALAITLVPFAHPDEWADACAYTDHRRAPNGDFVVGGAHYSTFVHDWRVVTPASWVAALSAQEIGAQVLQTRPSPGLAVIGEADFRAAVKQALRDFTRADRLRDNALLQSRLVSAKAGDSAPTPERVAALQELVRDAVAELAATPTDKRLARVLHRAYLSPAPTLERAAEVLDLPSSTFRRLLTSGVARITEALWNRELNTW